MPWDLGHYRARRLGPKRFRVVCPDGSYLKNEKGNESQYSSYQAANAAASKHYREGSRADPDLFETDT